MTIETKHNVGDTIYCLYDNLVKKLTIKQINICVQNKDKYYGHIDGMTYFTYTYYECVQETTAETTIIDNVPEHLCFKTKQELLDSL
jgi:hypothetical protein